MPFLKKGIFIRIALINFLKGSFIITSKRPWSVDWTKDEYDVWGNMALLDHNELEIN